MKPLIFGLTGPAGAGKSTAAAHLVQHRGFQEVAFADPLKDMLAALLGITRAMLDEQLAVREWREQPQPLLGDRTIRFAMQTLGTEWGRRLMHADLWVAHMTARLAGIADQARESGKVPRIVISDVRFANEAALVRTLGQLIHIARTDTDASAATRQHISENGVVWCLGDGMILNHRTVADLQREMDYAVDACVRHDMGLPERAR